MGTIEDMLGGNEMFCYQCQQTARGTGCTVKGVCGKDEDIQSLQDTLIFALKGIGAYAHHARLLGKRDETVDAFVHEALFKTLTNVDFDLEDFLGLVLRAGAINLKAMEILDAGNTETYGDPVPTKVATGTVKGPGILVTGHDFIDLEAILTQTEGKGVNVYTHGEMLPANAYPKLRKHKHLIGNYGGAWQKQRKEFVTFGGPVVATSNCVLIPPDAYRDRLFTTNITRVAGVKHIPHGPNGPDFTPVIEMAKKIGDLPQSPGRPLMTGFHHKVVLSMAGKVLDAIKDGKIRHIFLVGGCDGATPGRDYYTRFVEMVPKDCIVLTLACGKYRFNDIEMGDIDGIPRLMDMGQCNNAYSAIQVAVGLAKALGKDVNELPLSLVLSWFEQKAVAIVCTLLYLNIKNMRIGPTAPAFWTPNVLKTIQERYGLKLIDDPARDLKEMLG